MVELQTFSLNLISLGALDILRPKIENELSIQDRHPTRK